MPKRAQALTVSERRRRILESMVRARGTPAGRAERARVVLMSAERVSTAEQAKRLGVDRQRRLRRSVEHILLENR